MLRSAAQHVFRQHTNLWRLRYQIPGKCLSTMPQAEAQKQVKSNDVGKGNNIDPNSFVGQKISGREKINVLVKTLLDLDDSKDVVYGALDAWVAWEQNFPIAAIKNVLLALEKQQQWHRVIQVIKWMLSKGQGNTVGTYQQLIRALDMDRRAEEAHIFWRKKIGNDLHSVPWQTCRLMISVYYRNNMYDHLVKLFKSLEAFDRKPPEKSIVQKVADAYELLGMADEKERLLQKYADLLSRTRKDSDKKTKRNKSKRKDSSLGHEPGS